MCFLKALCASTVYFGNRSRKLVFKCPRKSVFCCFFRVQDVFASSTLTTIGVADLVPPVGLEDLVLPVGLVVLVPPFGLVDLAPPVGMVDLAPPVGTVDLAPPVGGSGPVWWAHPP